jgi:hypothetical protein
MTNYNVRVTEDNADLHIYTGAYSINIDSKNDKISIGYDDGKTGKIAEHQMSRTDEINIKANR